MPHIKTTILVCFTVCYLFSNEYLVSLKGLPKEEQKAYPVIEVIQDVCLILCDNTVLDQLKKQKRAFSLLDSNPQKQSYNYYVVYPMAEPSESIAKTGTIIEETDNILIIKVPTQKIDAFLALKVERMLIDFSPYIFRDVVPIELLNRSDDHNDLIEKVVAKVSKDSIRSYVKHMQEMKTRKARSNHDIVPPWLEAKCKELGADSVYRQKVSNGSYGDNVVAVLFGKDKSMSEYCLMGGHSDAVVSGAPAAGADDNASGTAATLEALRVFSQCSCDKTIQFIAFNAEEVGLVGSRVFAQTARKNNEKIIGGCINCDMIGYTKTTPTIFVHYRTSVSGNEELARLFAKSAHKYVPKLNVELLTSSDVQGASDQASFWRSGYPSFLAIEAKGFNSSQFPLCKNYHRKGDLLDDPGGLNDSELMTNTTRAAVATLADLAEISGTAISKKSIDKNKKRFTITQKGKKGLKINFSINAPSAFVSISIYNTAGKEIATVAPQKYSQGTHLIDLSLGNTATGLYYCVCQLEETIQHIPYISF